MIPRFGQPPEPGQAYRARPGAYGLLLRDGMALLTRREEPGSELQLPGGGIDPGESPIRSLHREVREETGWTISGPRWIAAYRRFAWLPDYGFWAEKICSIWLARPVLSHGAPTEPGHLAVWVPVADLAGMLTEPGSRAVIRQLVAGHHPALSGAGVRRRGASG